MRKGFLEVFLAFAAAIAIAIFGEIVNIVWGATSNLLTLNIAGWSAMLIFVFVGIYLAVRKSPKSSSIGDDVDLTKHPVFVLIEDKLTFIRHGFAMENQVKNALFRSILINVLYIYSSEIHSFINDYYSKTIHNSQEMYVRFSKILQRVNDRLGTFYKTAKVYSKEDQEALSVAIDCFLKLHIEDQKAYGPQTVQIVNDTLLFKTLTAKTTVLFNELMSIICSIFANVSVTLGCLNGKLSCCTYKGKVIGD